MPSNSGYSCVHSAESGSSQELQHPANERLKFCGRNGLPPFHFSTGDQHFKRLLRGNFLFGFFRVARTCTKLHSDFVASCGLPPERKVTLDPWLFLVNRFQRPCNVAQDNGLFQ